MPTAATNATVKTDTLTVFSEMSALSPVVRSLAKGEEVYVDLRVDQGNGRWCGIRIARQFSRLGFVDCRSLERTGPTQPTASANPGTKPTAAGKGGAEVPLARPAAPTINSYAAVQAQVVKDGVIDSAYIASADAQAKTGGSAALTRAALAHFAAGEFDLTQRNLDEALEQFDAMQDLAGRQPSLLTLSLLGRAYALLLKGDYSSALEPIQRARTLAPQSAEAAAMAGWAHFMLNQTDAAVADLQVAQRIRPSQDVAGLLAKVQQDRDIEGDFREGQSSHFIVRYHGGASRQLASEVIRTLEEQFQVLRSELHFTPPEPIGVILYTQEAFRDVTRVPGWTSAVYDGRIRVPVQGMETVSPELMHILKHELTHSFVYQKTAGRCPVWLHEGVAQWMEGRRSGADAQDLLAAFEQGKGTSLRYYEGSWMHLNAPQARFAYAWSLAVVEGIEAQSGPDAIERLLDAERTESSPEAALLQGLRTSYSHLDEATVAYLRQTYLQ